MDISTYERIIRRVRADARLFGDDDAKARQCTRIIALAKKRLAPHFAEEAARLHDKLAQSKLYTYA